MLKIDPSKIVRIECQTLPESFEFGEGEYELKYGHKPKDVFYYDITTLAKELKKLMPDRVDDILSRLQNFRKAYLNLDTGEISS